MVSGFFFILRRVYHLTVAILPSAVRVLQFENPCYREKEKETGNRSLILANEQLN